MTRDTCLQTSDIVDIQVIADGLQDAIALRSWPLVVRYTIKLEQLRRELDSGAGERIGILSHEQARTEP